LIVAAAGCLIANAAIDKTRATVIAPHRRRANARRRRVFSANRNIRIAHSLFIYDEVVANRARNPKPVSHGDAA